MEPKNEVPWSTFIVAMLVVIACAIAAQCDGVRAQELPAEVLTEQLVLARICASEIGLVGAPEECAAIYEVLRDRAQRNGWSFVEAAQRYSGRVFDRARQDDRAWVAHLRDDGEEPRGWPVMVVVRGQERRHAPWAAYRERWLRLYRAAGRIVRGRLASGCAQTVRHWGCRACGDELRAARAGWVEVECWVPRSSCDRACEEGELDEDGDGRCQDAPREDGVCYRRTRNAFWAFPEIVSDVVLR